MEASKNSVVQFVSTLPVGGSLGILTLPARRLGSQPATCAGPGETSPTHLAEIAAAPTHRRRQPTQLPKPEGTSTTALPIANHCTQLLHRISQSGIVLYIITT